jgi:hypothetical protein
VKDHRRNTGDRPRPEARHGWRTRRQAQRDERHEQQDASHD